MNVKASLLRLWRTMSFAWPGESGPFFVVEIGTAFIKVVKGIRSSSGVTFDVLRAEPVMADAGDATTAAAIALLRGLDVGRAPVYFSLPSHLATVRHLKVPAHDPQEIEKMVSLQAPRFLPYPPGDLVTGYVLRHVDKDGLAHVQATIAHRDAIEPYLKICRAIKLDQPRIYLSSQGLARLFAAAYPEEQGPVAVVDIDEQHADMVVISRGVLVFSRSLRFYGFGHDWRLQVADELERTFEMYAQDEGAAPMCRLVVLGRSVFAVELQEFLAARLRMPVEVLSLDGVVKTGELARRMLDPTISFNPLLGIGSNVPEDAALILSVEMKEALRQRVGQKARLEVVAVLAGALVLSVLRLAVEVHNKSVYLQRYNAQLMDLQNSLGPLEEISRRVTLHRKFPGRSSCLESLTGMVRLIPEGARLSRFEFDGTGQVVLRGRVMGLDQVFDLARRIEENGGSRGYAVSVTYATRKGAADAKAVDFEIIARRTR